MSVTKSIWVNCDCCGASYGSYGDHYETAAESRDAAKRGGWHRSKSRDICDWCWAEGHR